MSIDAVVLSFVLIPLFLVVFLAAAGATASRRLGEGQVAGRRALTVLVLGAAWMTATWYAAAGGVLRHWQSMPPPFAVLVVAIVGLASVMGSVRKDVGWRRACPSGFSSPFRDFACRSNWRCTPCTNAASCPSK